MSLQSLQNLLPVKISSHFAILTHCFFNYLLKIKLYDFLKIFSSLNSARRYASLFLKEVAEGPFHFIFQV